MPLRLRRAPGLAGRVNDVLYQPPATPQQHRQDALLFFGGDVQDYPEIMQSHRENKNYIRWNLDNTAIMLGQKFPSHHVLVVRPSRIEYKSFSCYDNFVPSNHAGVPDHTPTHSALLHLESLLQNLNEIIKSLPAAELLEATNKMLPEDVDIEDLHNAPINLELPNTSSNSNGSSTAQAVTSSGGDQNDTHKQTESLWWVEKLALDESRLTLVGFSKGCVVLNQVIYELHYTKTLTPGDDHMMRLISRIDSMYWLDGGHAGGSNTWVTSRSLLETLARRDINIYIHVSPYQVKDERRPWIGKEEKIFTSLLRKLGANVHRRLHGARGTHPPSLDVHFGVLEHFQNGWDERTTTSDESDDDGEHV